MGILSEIFSEVVAEVTAAFSEQPKPESIDVSAYQLAEPFEKQLYEMAGWERPKPAPPKVPEGMEYAPKNIPISRMQTEIEKHNHKHPAKTGSTVENRPSYVGSLGNVQTEGCAQHAEERYIQVAKPRVNSNSITMSEMRKAVIMSEILGKPKAKR